MARPRQRRYISEHPGATYFQPCGVPLDACDEVSLTVEGLEALRLSDLEGLTASEAASRLRVSRYAYGRTLGEARRAVARALVQGKILRIAGGAYEILPQDRLDGPHSTPRRTKAMNVIAISSEGPSLEDFVDPRYGRAGGFVIATYAADGAEPEIRYLDNGDAQVMASGAGIATTEHLADAGVTCVMSGYVGPKAFEALQAAGIAVVQDMDGITVGEVLARYARGEYVVAEAPNHEAGMPH